MSYNYEKAHNEDIAEITRLTTLCQEYRENGARLMRVADEYKAECERLKAEVSRLEPLQYRQAPCHKFCESTAYEIEARGLKAQIERLKAEVEAEKLYSKKALELSAIEHTTVNELAKNIERKDAALRVALESVELAHSLEPAWHEFTNTITTIKEAL